MSAQLLIAVGGGLAIGCCCCRASCCGSLTPSSATVPRSSPEDTIASLRIEVAQAEDALRSAMAVVSDSTAATTADVAAPKSHTSKKLQQCDTSARQIESLLASHQKQIDQLKVIELQTLIEGRGATPVTNRGAKLRNALVAQAKSLAPVVPDTCAPPAPEWQCRTTLLLGEESMAKLRDARVLVVGLGGVGGFVAEFLARGGVGHLTIVDDDVVAPSNRNRQLVALSSTEGQPKCKVLAQRILDINPDIVVDARQQFVPADASKVDELVGAGQYDFVIDCIDSLQPKVELIRSALKHKIRVVSSMGAGGRIDPSKVVVCDLSDLAWSRDTIRATKKADRKAINGAQGSAVAHTQPRAVALHEKLGTAVRKMLKQQYGIEGGVTVVTSSEMPRKAFATTANKSKNKASYYGTWACLPAAFGLQAASVALQALAAQTTQSKRDRKLRKEAERSAVLPKRN